MESHPYTKPRGVGPVTTQLTPGAEPASSKSAGAPGPWSCSPTCRAWSESSRPSLQIQRARVRAVLGARAIRVRALLGARAIIVEPHPPPFYTSSLTSPGFQIFAPRPPFGCSIAAVGAPKANPGKTVRATSRFDFFFREESCT